MKPIYENLRGTLTRFQRNADAKGLILKYVEVSRAEFDTLQIETPEVVLEPFADAENIIDGVKIVLINAPNRRNTVE